MQFGVLNGMAMNDQMKTETKALSDGLGTSPARTGNGPLVSVIMSNFNGSAYLEAAVTSVLDQSHAALELIVVDDASTDGSQKILHQLATLDDRVRPIELETNLGPAGARNAAIEAARGEWIAIIDADDLVHPQRIERLLATAEQMGADAIADDLLSFGSADVAGQTLLWDDRAERSRRLTATDLIRSDTVVAGLASFGYLKPMIRRDALEPLRYQETLRIGEDFDLYCRLLLGGVIFLTTPDPTYLYRRHTESLSHRLSAAPLTRLIAAHETLAELAAIAHPNDRELRLQLARRKARLERALRYQHLVTALKTQGVLNAARHLWRYPGLLREMLNSLSDRGRRMMSSVWHRSSGETKTVVLAAPDRMDQVSAPPDAIRIPVGAAPSPNASTWSARRAMARRLAKLASRGPIDVIAEGPAGVDALGYLPTWRSTRLALREQNTGTTSIPRDAGLKLS